MTANLSLFLPYFQVAYQADLEKVVDPANLVRRKYSEKPDLAENI